MAQKRKFYTKKGKETDIMHSYNYYSSPYAARRDAAFNKEFLSTLSQRDLDLMRGYAQAKVEEVSAFRYNNPNYKRKANVRKPLSASNLNKFFGNR